MKLSGSCKHFRLKIMLLLISFLCSLSAINCKQNAVGTVEKTSKERFVRYTVPTGTMLPTIKPGYTAIGQLDAYKNSNPKRGDIIVFKPLPGISNANVPFMKRVIAVGGETVEIKAGKVFINGKMLSEPYIKNFGTGDMTVVTVPEGTLFVMGDNRPNSYDSRMWSKPFLPVENIIAKVVKIDKQAEQSEKVE